MVRTSVVIPTHNGAPTLGAQLDALAEQAADVDFEVIVVDNNSTDATPAVVAAHADRVPGLRLEPAHAGAGVSYARNSGTHAARGEFILYCDCDDVVRPGWVRAMTEALEDADLVGGVLDVTQINPPSVLKLSGGPPADSLPVAMRYLPYAVGANLGVRRSLWEELGGFDESYVGGHEEVDFAWRAQEAGRRIAFVPEAVIDYRLRGSVRSVLRQRFYYGRSYAQLYSRFQDAPIPRASARHEVRTVAMLVAQGPRRVVQGSGHRWLSSLAWTAGRWRGGRVYGVRAPL